MVDSTNLPEIDINAIVTDLNNKADRDLVNSIPPYVVSRTPNSQGVVEIWSDGYCVQTGRISLTIGTSDVGFTINLDQAYKDTSYIPIVKVFGGYAAHNIANVENKSQNSFTGYVTSNNSSTKDIEYIVYGYIR